MAIGAGMSCVKYLLFALNLLFAITGLIIFILGVTAGATNATYTNITEENFYYAAPVVLVLLGVIVFVVAFLGCCGAIKENNCMILTFAGCLVVILMAEVGVGIAGYVKHGDLEQTIVGGLNKTIKEYPTNADVRQSYDILQTDLHCCGIYGPADWATNKLPIPASCCKDAAIVNGVVAECTADSPSLHTDGCLNQLLSQLQKAAVVLGGAAIGVAVAQLVGVLFACCLARSIRSQYETV